MLGAPFFVAVLISAWYWVPAWLLIVRIFSAVVLVVGIWSWVVLISRWRKNSVSKTSRIFAVLVAIILVVYYVVGFAALALAKHQYEDAIASYQIPLSTGNHTFYVCEAHSWQFFFDGGYQVWVTEPGSLFVERVDEPVWKSQYAGDYEVSGNAVRFYFYDDNPLSNRGSGDTFIEYVDR